MALVFMSLSYDDSKGGGYHAATSVHHDEFEARGARCGSVVALYRGKEGNIGILTKDMKRVVREQRLGFVATVCPDGTPNLSPKGTTSVWDDDNLVFAHLYSPNTIENLRHNPAVEINVVDPIVRKGYRFKGTAQVLTEGPLYQQIMAMYRGEEGHDPLRDADGRVRAVVLVKVERALPLISPAYDDGATEEKVVAQWERYWDSLREKRRMSQEVVLQP
jgi:predicted pyridoxine 5'-phosphate oxidase superfamily flavin-nucleotide-binding protein